MIMAAITEYPMLEKVHSFARQARLANFNQEPLNITPEMAGVLAEYLREALATAQDQAWFWTKEWQAGEREAEADLTAGRCQVFETMDDLINDLGWSQ